MTQVDKRAMLLPKPVTPCTKVMGGFVAFGIRLLKMFGHHLFGAAPQAAEKTAHGTSYRVTQKFASLP